MHKRTACRILPVLLWLGASAVAAQSPTAPAPLFDKPTQVRGLAQRWELDSASKRGTFLITPYKPVYITAGRLSSSPNEQPTSENLAYSLPFRVDYGKYEAKFQISFKVKVLQEIFGKHGDLWIAYTQRSHWQLYNTTFSRPFRETNYEPEVLLNFATDFKLLGLRTRMVGIGFNHQSNGRALPLSRSWNRIVAYAGLERGKWTIYLRPWFRLPDAEDENPAIADHIGRADATVIYDAGRSLFALTGSHPLRWSAINRGQLLFDWTYRVKGNFRGHLQLMQGYGETLIDYNHAQFTIGVSAALVEWL